MEIEAPDYTAEEQLTPEERTEWEHIIETLGWASVGESRIAWYYAAVAAEMRRSLPDVLPQPDRAPGVAR